jgi:hypothetical protein
VIGARQRLRSTALVAVGLLAATAALLALPSAGDLAPVVRAAGPGLTMVGSATYDVRPTSHLVHVTVQMSVTNHLTDTVIQRYTFSRVDVTVPPTAVHAAATAGTKKVSVSQVSRNSSQAVLSVGLGGSLGSGHTTSVSLAFDLPDPGGRADRPVRVGPSLITFPVWAFGSSGLGGARVVVRFPAGYDVRVVAGTLGAPVVAPDGTISVTAGAIADPLAFNAVVAADRQSSFVETKVDLEIDNEPVSLVVRAWPDDAAWGTKMTKLLKSSLPLLAGEIGLPYQPSAPVVAVEEALPRSIDGYAATYLPDEGTIQIAYTADDTIAIHELAHLWFDGSLFADRWIDDGFAIFYGNRVAQQLKLKPADESITPALAAAAVPLNTWSGTDATAGATSETAASALADRYGRAAAVTIAGRLYSLVGAGGLQTVWRAASAREAAYQPAGQVLPTLVSDGPPDWRGLLDLITERTGVDATELWASLVVTPTEQSLLATRTAARSQYSALLARSSSWSVPQAVVDALNAWQYSSAIELMTGLDQLLDQRDRIAAAAATAGLTAPSSLQAAFQQGATATAETDASNELQVIDAISTATAAEPAAPSLLEQVGLLGQDPGAGLAAASTAFSAGDMAAARLDALAADVVWSQASDTGGFRVRIAIASFLVTAVVLGFVIGQLRRIGRLGRRSRRRAPAGKSIGAPLGSRPTHYPTRYPSGDSARTSRGTLADQPVRMARRVRPEPKEGDKSS